VGKWSIPFEEGGKVKPRCWNVTEAGVRRLQCKPTAVTAGMLPDGRILYANGLEGSENFSYAEYFELAAESRDSLSRVLDLRTGKPTWTTPRHPTGAATSPDIKRGHQGTDDPFGMAGVPGRPGDGFVGSLWGELGLPEQNPSSPPDDPQDNDGDLFCGDTVQLPDGRYLAAGGTDWYYEPGFMDRESGAPMAAGMTELDGIRSTRIFDPATNSWRATGNMKFGRWYPSMVTLSDGKVLIVSGVKKLVKSTQLSQVRRTETYNPATGRWTENYVGPASENSLPLYPRIFLTPNGKVFYGGNGQQYGAFGESIDEATFGFQQFFDPKTKEWESVGLHPTLLPRSSPLEVMLPLKPPYRSATILTAGGAVGPPPDFWLAVPFSHLTTVTAGGEVTNESTGNLNAPRWFGMGVTLPDGTVIAFSGADKDENIFPGYEIPNRMPEQYDPRTGEWTTLAPSSRDRTYHNSAMLLPDGRVLVGGHAPHATGYGTYGTAVPGMTANNNRDSSFELYSPPYLFRGPRPRIDRVQAGLAWGKPFEIRTPQASEIESVMLMRLASPQHVMDNDARALYLAFQRGSGSLVATAPPGGNVAPPGYYYLFINRRSAKGPIPSVAAVVHVGPTNKRSPASIPMDGRPIDTSIGATPVE
jgi:hypothetical protein